MKYLIFYKEIMQEVDGDEILEPIRGEEIMQAVEQINPETRQKEMIQKGTGKRKIEMVGTGLFNKKLVGTGTYEIKGYSDGDITMELPYVESDTEPLLLWNYKIEDGQLKVIKESFTDEEWDKIIKDGKL